MMTPHRSSVAALAAAATAVLVMGCAAGSPTPPAPTAADAKAFLDTVNQTMLKLGVLESQAGWVAQNFITDDTEGISAASTSNASTPSRNSRRTRRGSTSWTCPPTSAG
jgi:peptidyl-dipeptidase A